MILAMIFWWFSDDFGKLFKTMIFWWFSDDFVMILAMIFWWIFDDFILAMILFQENMLTSFESFSNFPVSKSL